MADLLSHGAAAVLVKAATLWRMVPVFVAGTLAPDMLSRAPAIAMGWVHRELIPLHPMLTYGWDPLHQPVGMLILAYVLSMLFAQEQRRSVFLNLVGGMALHMGLDLLQDHQGVGYLLAYPFSDVLFELGWIGSEDSVLVAPVLAAGALIAIRVRNRKTHQNGMT